VERAQDRLCSSFHRLVRLGIYPEDWAGDAEDKNARFGER
jgi:putative transposase